MNQFGWDKDKIYFDLLKYIMPNHKLYNYMHGRPHKSVCIYTFIYFKSSNNKSKDNNKIYKRIINILGSSKIFLF